MYHRKAETVTIKLSKDMGTNKFVKALLTMHDSWLEVIGWKVEMDYQPAVGNYSKAVRGRVQQQPVNRIYPEAAIVYLEIDNTKVSMRQFKKGFE